MNFNEQLFDKIEDYLKGKLPVKDVAAFEKEIATDSALAEMVALHRFEQEGMEYLVEKDLTQKLKDWETKPPEDQGKKNDRNSFGRYGFGLLIIIGIAAIFFWNQNPGSGGNQDPVKEVIEVKENPVETPSNNPNIEIPEEEPSKKNREIAETKEAEKKQSTPKRDPVIPTQNNYLALAETTHSIPDNLSSGLRSTDPEDKQNVLSAGLKAFSADQMDKAIVALSKIDKEKNPNEYEQAQEYLAHAYFKTGHYKQAAAIFQSISDQSKMITHDRAEWYLVLSLLPDYKNNKTEIDSFLEKMIAPESYHNYAESAAKLKAELEKINN
jgi:tetratricopeptide (TPR) repeat protein